MSVFHEGDRGHYAAALLRLLLAMRREPEVATDELVERVVEETGIEAGRFREFLAARAEVFERVAARR